jgi:3-hydroxymyristoyl/3-hydroxydecanoyl-(acyl carrier protein) dehydratase
MEQGKDVLVIGAREGGYGASIAASAVTSGFRVFGTSLNPSDPEEQAFFNRLGIRLIPVPLKFDADRTRETFAQLAEIVSFLQNQGVSRLHAVVHAVAGGFPRQPSVMKSVSDILRGKRTFGDLATEVKKNVYYVNATSFQDMAEGLCALLDADTHLMGLTYLGEMPYFIAPTKRYLERLATRMASRGRRTLVVALPEAWTQSSQFFMGIEISVMNNYLREIEGRSGATPELAEPLQRLHESLAEVEGLQSVLPDVTGFLQSDWDGLVASGNQAALYSRVSEFFAGLRSRGNFPPLRRAVEIVSDYVRKTCGIFVVREFLEQGNYRAGEVRQIQYRDLPGPTSSRGVLTRPQAPRLLGRRRNWVTYEKDEIRKTLRMYGDNFLFLDRVIMEEGGFVDGALGFGSFVVPGPDENPIMRDHFVEMPLFGGHLQMEAVAQFGTFMILKLMRDSRLVPILTGTEFPDLDTMAPPGEKLTMMGKIHVPEKRHLALEAFVENRFARSRGIIRGMVLAERIVKKMASSFPGQP